MNTSSKFTKEDICAFIDGEMPEGRVELIEKEMQHDISLHEEINAMRKIRSLYRMSYQDTSANTSAVERSTQAYNIRAPFLAFAASLFIAVGISVGWILHSTTVVQTVMSSEPKNFFSLKELVHADTNINTTNVIFRLKENPKHLIAMLDDIEHLLVKYEKNNKKLNLEVMAHAAGLNILRVDVTPAGRRIQDLMSRYSNLTFLACSKTIRRLKNEKGIDVKLLPGVVVVPSAIEQVLKRLQEKWAYVHV